MRKIKKNYMKRFLSILLGTTLVVSLSACSLFPSSDDGNGTTSGTKKTTKESNVDPAVVIKDMQNSMQDIKAGTYEFSANIDIDAEEGSGSLELTLDGYESIMDENAPEGYFTLGTTFDFDADGEQVAGNAELEFVFKEAMAYLSLNDLSLEGEGLDEAVSMVEEYVGTWYSMPFEIKASDFDLSTFSEEFSKEFQAGLMEDEDMTEEQAKKIEELLKETEWLETTNNKGTKKVNGVEAYVFEVKLQKENVMDFLKQLGDIFEEDITDEELADAEAMIDAITFEGTLYIGVDDNYLYKFDGTVGIEITEDMKDMGGENVSMSANIVISMSDFDKEKDVDVPENSEDLMELIGTMMGGMYGGGTYDDTDYEAYDDIDWSEYDDSEWENWEDEDWGDLETDLDVTEDTTEVTTE